MAISQWFKTDRVYDGTGAPKLYTDFAIITCHEIRLVYKLPLRQSQGLIDSILQLMSIPLSCPDSSVLSRPLASLNIKVPRYKKSENPDNHIHVIAIDSTGLSGLGVVNGIGKNTSHQEKQAGENFIWPSTKTILNTSLTIGFLKNERD